MKKPFVCTHDGCTKTYTTRFSLRRHMASHSSVKKHVCVLCFKSFTLAQYLKEHTYTHTKQKPFACDFPGCNRAFRQAGKLSLHKRTHQNLIFDIKRVKRDYDLPSQQSLPISPSKKISIPVPRLPTEPCSELQQCDHSCSGHHHHHHHKDSEEKKIVSDKQAFPNENSINSEVISNANSLRMESDASKSIQMSQKHVQIPL